MPRPHICLVRFWDDYGWRPVCTLDTLAQQLAGLIESAGGRGLTQRELCRKSRTFDRCPWDVQERVLSALTNQGRIAKWHLTKPGTRGRRRAAWVAT